MPRRGRRVAAWCGRAAVLLGLGAHAPAACTPGERDAVADAAPSVTASPSSSPADAATDAASEQRDGAVDGGLGPARRPTDWRAAARQGAWPDVVTMITALPEQERRRPEIRLALGRAALGAGQMAEAARSLEGLGAELPTLAPEIESWWLAAAAFAGPHEQAARQLSRSSRVADLVLAAEAYGRAGKPKLARETIDVAVSRADRLRREGDQVRARLTRAAIAAKAGDTTVAFIDWRWIVTAPGAPPAVREALDGLARLGLSLGAEPEIEAIAQSSSPSNIEPSLRRIDELAKSPKVSAITAALGRARALWHVRDYRRARDAFDAAALLPSGFKPEALYFAGRSAARAGDADGALQRFVALEKAHPSSPWTERSSEQRSQLLLQLGRFAEAAESFARHLGRYGRGKGSTAEQHGHALALLSSGKAKQAKALFVALRKEESTGTYLDSALRELEGLAAERSGDRKGAEKIWLELVRGEPLTYGALAAHARLRSSRADAVPPLCAPVQSNAVAAPLAPSMPAPVAALHAVGLDEAAEERLALLEDHVTSRHPGRESEALCALYGQLAGGRRQLQIGSRATSWAELMTLPTARERWAWSCVYPEPYGDLVRAAEQRYQVPHGLVHAIMRQESAFRVDARSEAGAQGLMQLMPNTAERAMLEIGRSFGPETDVLRPDVNVELGAFYLGKLLRSLGGSVPLAVAAYNAGPLAVREWLRAPAEREVDLWVARIPYAETREYVMRVLGNFARYQYLRGGAAAVSPLELALPTEVSVGEDAY